MANEILLQAKGVNANQSARLAQAAVAAATGNLSGQISNLQNISDSVAGEAGFYGVRFRLTPEITEAGSVSYAEIHEARVPASFLIYIGTPSRTWSINAKMLSRTVEEADRTWREINILRSWRMPENGAMSVDGGGNAPTIVNLYGYGKTFQAIPTVITSLNIEWPSDVDYIKDSQGTDIPILMSVSISLKEAHQHQDIMNDFNILSYRLGTLEHWS